MTFETTIFPLLGQISAYADEDPPVVMMSASLKYLETVFIYAFSLALLAGFLWLVHFLFSLPMRRAERMRLFLALVEDAINRGQSIEAMILSVAESRDRMVGIRFYILAAHIEGGLNFVEALEKVPRFLPPQIIAMLRAGEKFGDLKKVLPACHEILRDRPAGVRSAVHYLISVVFLFSPFFIFMVVVLMVWVIPQFKMVAAGMNIRLWPYTIFVFALNDSHILIGLEIILFLVLAMAALFYIGGPGLVRWFQFRSVPIVDWLAWRIPWKQKRLQRTFSAMLAVLLDGGVPEAEAVRLAGESTANEICRRRSLRVIVAIEQGTKLDDAIRKFDDTGEFHWRLANAVHARGGFLDALRGWHEALDAKAFQQEEATAHIVTSGLVVLNGLMVALIATAMFGILIAVLNGMVAAE
jgi:type IV pilus assembly protein PilC